MRNLLVEICYNGARYHGYQVQANAISVAEVLQDNIQKLLHVREPIIGCSRTDTKVHARSYFFTMKTQTKIPNERFVTIMNNSLPNDIVVLSCRDVSLDFHIRHQCIGKEYVYKIFNSNVRDPFLADLALFHKKHIDEVLLDKTAKAFIGTHDFTSFCSLGYKEGTCMTKTVSELEVTREGDFVYVRIKANSFLYNMVRIIVGTLLYVNDGKFKPEDIPQIIIAKDRTKAGKTAPPQGLYLNEYYFTEE